MDRNLLRFMRVKLKILIYKICTASSKQFTYVTAMIFAYLDKVAPVS